MSSRLAGANNFSSHHYYQLQWLLMLWGRQKTSVTICTRSQFSPHQHLRALPTLTTFLPRKIHLRTLRGEDHVKPTLPLKIKMVAQHSLIYYSNKMVISTNLK